MGEGLRRRGIDVTLSADVGLLGATDVQQLEYATENQRVLVTYDDDFLRLHAAMPGHAGIYFARQRRRTLGQLILKIVRLARVVTDDTASGTVTYL